MEKSYQDYILTKDLAVFDHIPGMFYRCRIYPSQDNNMYNYTFTLDFVSNGSYDLIGFTPKEMLKSGWNAIERLMHPEDVERTHNYSYDQVIKKEPYQIKYRLELPNGISKWVWDMGGGVFDKNGNPLYFEGLVMDISEQKFQELELAEENKQLKSSLRSFASLGEIIGKSAKMQKVYELIMKAAQNDMNVIIYGETGCGKELVAKAIHEYSGAHGDYIPVNCGAIPEQLMESEFFGYVKGAFSGATANTKGYICAADSGTLFLDEIGELSLNLQAKLLRALENKSYTPLGTNTPKTSNFRLISATNKDLAQMVQDKEMRSDLYYRLNVLVINLPPLRERKEDIPLLVSAYLEKKAYTANLSFKIQIAMQQYHWPGNVRELFNFLDRFIVFGEQALGDLQIEANSSMDFAIPTHFNYKEASISFERSFIKNALEFCNGQKGKCAKLLDMNLRTFQRKLKALDIND